MSWVALFSTTLVLWVGNYTRYYNKSVRYSKTLITLISKVLQDCNYIRNCSYHFFVKTLLNLTLRTCSVIYSHVMQHLPHISRLMHKRVFFRNISICVVLNDMPLSCHNKLGPLQKSTYISWFNQTCSFKGNTHLWRYNRHPLDASYSRYLF